MSRWGTRRFIGWLVSHGERATSTALTSIVDIARIIKPRGARLFYHLTIMRPIHALSLVLLAASLACVNSDPRVSRDTRITPDVFQYATIVDPPTDGSTGGWRAVCVKIELQKRTGDNTPARCGLEYGTPIVNRQLGHIPLHRAQSISAKVSNEVGLKVLKQERGITSTTCDKLQRALNKGMDDAIKGSKVTQCGVTRWERPVPEVIWPPPRE